MEVVILFGVVIVIGIFFRLIAGGMDHERVDRYIESKGGKIIDKQWNPFGKGWFGEKDSRIYEITYRDREGNVHEATCKTSLFSGVYFTEDRVISYVVETGPSKEALTEEVDRLRAELARLKSKQ